MKIRLIILFAVLIAFTACRKDGIKASKKETPLTLGLVKASIIGKWKIKSTVTKYSLNKDTVYTQTWPIDESYKEYKDNGDVIASTVSISNGQTMTTAQTAKYDIKSNGDKFYIVITYRGTEESEIIILNNTNLVDSRSGEATYYLKNDQQYPCDKQTYVETYQRVQ